MPQSARQSCPGYFNPRSPHGERRNSSLPVSRLWTISIHAPRTGSDRRGRPPDSAAAAFQSTLPARGATGGGRIPTLYASAFQSTLPARGATRCSRRRTSITRYFNPRSPHGERHIRKHPEHHIKQISIHAPRTGSDQMAIMYWELLTDFNPRSPHGERPRISCTRCGTTLFQSTLPARGATNDVFYTAPEGWSFQSTLPARGATPCAAAVFLVDFSFQSTLPARGATFLIS